MSKVKVPTGLAAVILCASLFAGWQTLLIVAVLLLLFADVEDVKGMIVRVITFYVGLTLFSAIWGLIVDGVDLVFDSIINFINVINNWVDKPITIVNIQQYFITPVTGLVNIADDIVSYLIVFAKVAFIYAFISKTATKETFISKWINKYIDKAVNFVNGTEASK